MDNQSYNHNRVKSPMPCKPVSKHVVLTWYVVRSFPNIDVPVTMLLFLGVPTYDRSTVVEVSYSNLNSDLNEHGRVQRLPKGLLTTIFAFWMTIEFWRIGLW